MAHLVDIIIMIFGFAMPVLFGLGVCLVTAMAVRGIIIYLVDYDDAGNPIPDEVEPEGEPEPLEPQEEPQEEPESEPAPGAATPPAAGTGNNTGASSSSGSSSTNT